MSSGIEKQQKVRSLAIADLSAGDVISYRSNGGVAESSGCDSYFTRVSLEMLDGEGRFMASGVDVMANEVEEISQIETSFAGVDGMLLGVEIYLPGKPEPNKRREDWHAKTQTVLGKLITGGEVMYLNSELEQSWLPGASTTFSISYLDPPQTGSR